MGIEYESEEAMNFFDESYGKFLKQCSLQDVLRFLSLLWHHLGEVHARGVVHNDLKAINITVSGVVHRRVLHVIDLGWACLAGHVTKGFNLETGDEDDFPRECLEAKCS
ncbi:hypothetical protein E2C01_062934 [Portunus trituberculatus]|uniref:Protein kinase domain-containing protein n=1 Tax=Portunus trituberculatus TaxID=210409 RepID=A0A5B7HIX4_PORTR|nr:hypothetical protein [Portunus trituberculatus]